MIAQYIEQAFAEVTQADPIKEFTVSDVSVFRQEWGVSVKVGMEAIIHIPTGRNEHEEAQEIVNILHAAAGQASAKMPYVKPVVLHGSVGGYPTAVEE